MKILIADDDPRILESCSKALSRSNFLVDTAENGVSALKKAKKGKYEVIVLDINFPDKSGFEIISDLRASEVETPILVISSQFLVTDKVKGLNLGADDYLGKNFSLEELVARVRALTRRRESTRKIIFESGDLKVNFSKLSVSRGEKKIELSKKEFGILAELIKRKDEVTTRQNLIEAVWMNREVNIFSNIIDVHIRSLRKKLDEPFIHKFIKTVRGHGYIFNCAE